VIERSLALGLLGLSAACAAAPQPAARPPARVRASSPAPLPVATAVSEEPEPALPAAGAPKCPDDMALVRRIQGPYCIDRYEAALDRRGAPHPFNHDVDGIEKEVVAVSVKGRKPQGYISGELAVIACKNAGKRLCETDEWVRACRGPKLTRYPYGDVRKANVCNDRFKVLDHHPVPVLWRKDPTSADSTLMWHPRFMNDPRLLTMAFTIVQSGAFDKCTNEYGVYDMVGNLHEWVKDAEGTFRGGFFMDTFQNGEGCDYRTRAHPLEYHDYSTGFRCCADAAAGE
jgi:hypothetical protein